MKVYLSGPIFGCSDERAKGWRDRAKAMRPEIEWLDPMRRDFRLGVTPASEIIKCDLEDIRSCDALLVNASRPGWGTAMELAYAREMQWLTSRPIRVVAFSTRRPCSPWLEGHVDLICSSLEDAVRAL